MVKKYIPKQGDLITLNFDPQSGHEQSGKRPALVISNEVFNRGAGLAIVCPVTSIDKKYPFHLSLHGCKKLHGFVMVEHLKSVDYNAREAKYVESVSDEFIINIKSMIEVCL